MEYEDDGNKIQKWMVTGQGSDVNFIIVVVMVHAWVNKSVYIFSLTICNCVPISNFFVNSLLTKLATFNYNMKVTG